MEVLASLLNDPNPLTVKVVIQCFGTSYPLLFRLLYVVALIGPRELCLT